MYHQLFHEWNIIIDKLGILWNFGKKKHIFPEINADAGIKHVLYQYFFLYYFA